MICCFLVAFSQFQPREELLLSKNNTFLLLESTYLFNYADIRSHCGIFAKICRWFEAICLSVVLHSSKILIMTLFNFLLNEKLIIFTRYFLIVPLHRNQVIYLRRGVIFQFHLTQSNQL